MDFKGRPIPREIVTRMTRALAHRGPDAENFHFNRSDTPDNSSAKATVAFGHRRLKVIDLASGQQPLSNEDGSVWVTFNGEIYNYRALREDLLAQGHQFKTQSDTEVIVHAYESYGPECVRYFRGMFAFGLWDETRQRLLLARDRLGKKPLVYALAEDRLVFASELPALLQHPSIPRRLDYEAIHHYLTYRCIPAPWTVYAGVKKLPPAHILLCEGEKMQLMRYWQLDFFKKRRIDAADAVEETGRLLTESVRLRLQSDVPLGILLSGGVDSSAVAGLASRECSTPVKTFSIGFEEGPFNELPYARTVAHQFHTDHHETIVRPDAVGILSQLVAHFGEPFADSSAVPTFYVAQMAKQYVTVVLNGDGGDETFGGYYRHLAMRLADAYCTLPVWLRKGLMDPALRFWPERLSLGAGPVRLKRFIAGAALSRADRWTQWIGLFSEEEKREMYTDEMSAHTRSMDSRDLLRELFLPLKDLDGVDAALAVDTSFYLPNDLLVKVDIATMAYGLEARSPLLDHELMEFTASLPSTLKVRGNTLKYLLKTAQKNTFPAQHLKRPKQGFAVPVSDWFRNTLREWVQEKLLSPQAAIHQFLSRTKLQEVVQLHVTGEHDFGQRLWALVTLEEWLEQQGLKHASF